jgi:Leucine-rich repeat (LRR) protein
MSIVCFRNTSVSYNEIAFELTNEAVTSVFLIGVEIYGTASDLTLAKALRGHANLKQFHLRDVTLRDSESAATTSSFDLILSMLFIAVPNLSVVHIENTKLPPNALQALSHCTTLQTLRLIKCQLTDFHASTIAAVLQSSHSCIERIDLSGNDMTDIGCKCLAVSLNKSTLKFSVQDIKLNDNRISGGGLMKIKLTMMQRRATGVRGTGVHTTGAAKGSCAIAA